MVYFNGASGLTWDSSQRQNSSAYYQLLREHGWQRPPYSTRYPKLALLHDYFEGTNDDVIPCANDPTHCGPAPGGTAIISNVFLNATSVPFEFPPPESHFNSSNFDTRGNFIAADPDAAPRQGAAPAR